MLRRASKNKAKKASKDVESSTIGKPTGDAAVFLDSLQNPEVIERVRTTIKDAHVFKLPPRQSATIGWRGADWKEKVWQGTVKVVERGDITAVLLVDRTNGSIFAVCPVKDGAIDRCVDSSRYFVLRIENANGRHMFVGVAFNERNDAFDFNTALEDSKREREMENNPVKPYTGPTKDYSIKEGEKIRVSIPKIGGAGTGTRKSTTKVTESKGFLKPSNKDTPSRTETGVGGLEPRSVAHKPENGVSDSGLEETFACGAFGGNNFFSDTTDEESTGSGNPFFRSPGTEATSFDPSRYQTESGR